jgi:hypothetical protein
MFVFYIFEGGGVDTLISKNILFGSGLAGKYQWQEFPVVITGKYRPGKYSIF